MDGTEAEGGGGDDGQARSDAVLARLRARGDQRTRSEQRALEAWIRESQRDLDMVEFALERRTEILRATRASLLADPVMHTEEQADAIAIVDLFVEKAQQVLTERARRMVRRADIATAAVVLLMASAAVFVGYVITSGIHEPPPELDTNALILRLAQSLSFGAFGLVAVKYLTSLARAFFHESTKILDRRHALRFGRLYVHLNARRIGSHRPGSVEVFDVEHLARAFDWNIDAPSAFLDVDPKVVADTIWNRIVDQVGSVPAETLAAAATKATKTT